MDDIITFILPGHTDENPVVLEESLLDAMSEDDMISCQLAAPLECNAKGPQGR